MPEQGDTRKVAGTASDGDLAARLDEMERQLLRTQSRQRALIHALARMSMSFSGEMERLTAD